MTTIPKPVKRMKAPKPIRRSALSGKAKRPPISDSGEKRTRRKRSPLKKAQDRLWKVFSAHVKERDGNVCFSCGASGLEGNGWHAGHMFPAGGSNILRYHPLNVHSQCYKCNINFGGNGAAYASRFIEVYGIDQLVYLDSIRRQQKQWRETDIVDLVMALKAGGADYELLYAEKIGSFFVPSIVDSTERKSGSTDCKETA